MAVSYFGDFTFIMQKGYLSALELFLEFYGSESNVVKDSDERKITLNITESLTKDYTLMYYIGLFLNRFAQELEGEVFCEDDTETEKDRYFVENGKIGYCFYYYDDSNKKTITQEDLVLRLSEEDRLSNVSSSNIENYYLNQLWDVVGFADDLDNVINGLVQEVNSSTEGSATIFLEDSKIIITKENIYLLDFLPGETKKIDNLITEIPSLYEHDFKLFILFEHSTSEDDKSMMKYKDAYYPFNEKLYTYDVFVKSKEWTHTCDLCVNKLKSLINGKCMPCNPDFSQI